LFFLPLPFFPHPSSPSVTGKLVRGLHCSRESGTVAPSPLFLPVLSEGCSLLFAKPPHSWLVIVVKVVCFFLSLYLEAPPLPRCAPFPLKSDLSSLFPVHPVTSMRPQLGNLFPEKLPPPTPNPFLPQLWAGGSQTTRFAKACLTVSPPPLPWFFSESASFPCAVLFQQPQNGVPISLLFLQGL